MSRLTPHPGYRLLWLALHVGSFVGWLILLALGWDPTWPMTGYIAAVALLEAVALWRIRKGRDGSGTWSWSVWAWLEDGTGFAAFWRLALVLAWVAWFCAMWLLYVPLPAWFKGPVFLAFGLWLVGWHFFGRKGD